MDPAGEHVDRWRSEGRFVDLPVGRVFVHDTPATDPAAGDPVVVLHGFPTCSFDWRLVLDDLHAGGRRVVLFDFIGFGLSDKPDRRYGIDLHADTAEQVALELGISSLVLVSHDMGDSVGGELLARIDAGVCPLTVSARVVSNGSIYLDLAHLTEGQQMLLALDDARLPSGLMDADGGARFKAGLAQVFSPTFPASHEELDAQFELANHDDGLSLMPRLIRYLEDRRVSEVRYTGAIETHPSPLTVIWGEVDPVAVLAMAERLTGRRPDAVVVQLPQVGHYPMIEAPEAFGEALRDALGRA